jgi:hypothetical protein
MPQLASVSFKFLLNDYSEVQQYSVWLAKSTLKKTFSKLTALFFDVIGVQLQI